MAPPGDEALYASPPSSPGPATPPLRPTLLDDCEVSPLSLPAAHFPPASNSPVLSTQLLRPEVGGAKNLAFTLLTPSPPAGRRNAIAQVADSEKDTHDNSNDEYTAINNLDNYTMARGDPRRKSSLQNEYDYDDASSDDSACGPDELPGHKISDTSSKGDPVLFRHRVVKVAIIYSDPAHPSFGNPMTSDKIPHNSKGKAVAAPAADDDSRLNEPPMSSPTLVTLAIRSKLPPTQDHDTLSTAKNDGAIRPNRANALRSSSDQASTWGSSLYGGSGSGSGVGSSNTGDRLTSGSSLLPRLRDSSLTTQYMPSSPPQPYRPPHIRAGHASPSAADVASIFAQRGNANPNGQPLVRPFEPAQFIPDPYQSFPGSEPLGVPHGAGYAAGAHSRGEHFGIGQIGSGMPYSTLASHYQAARSFDPLARDFVPDPLGGGFGQYQPYVPQIYQRPIYTLPPLPQPPYKGAGPRPRSHLQRDDTSHGNPHIPTHLNTCLWIEGLPPTTTYPSLLSSIHSCGRIFCTYINTPQRGHVTSACKVAFFSRLGAERLFEQCLRGDFVIDGVQVRRVRWNRNAYSGHPDPVATRCLLIRGPAKWVNLKTLTCYFQALFWWHLISVDDIPLDVAAKMAGDNGWLESGLRDDLAEGYREMAAMRWEFASFHAQAQAAKLAFERETAFMGLVRVDYLPDCCDNTE